MDADTQHHFEKLLGYIIRTDARFMALEMTIAEVSRHTEKQKEAFRDKVDKNFEVIYEIMLGAERRR